tara:strand:- start:427 stop:945 length:519 start_codon:yes stop_codon:yes gene_type:complete
MLLINLSQIRSILYLLSKNGNAIFKTFLPLLLPLNINLIYILYKSFDYIYFYKPLQNPSSSEIYVICKGYNLIYNQKILNKSFNINSKNIKKDTYISNIESSFLESYNDIISQMIMNNVNSIERSVYIYDNYKNSNKFKEYIEYIKDSKDKVIQFWINEFNFKLKKNIIYNF